MKKSLLAVSCGVLLALFFCTAALSEAEKNTGPERKEIWLDLYIGEPLSFEDLLADLVTADSIFLGERHTVARHHDRQLDIVNALGKEDRPLVLGIEMMEKRFQSELDRYCKGEISFEELAEATDWRKNWSNYEDYKGVIEAARKVGATILALNADATIVRKIGRKGLDALSPDERQTLPKKLRLDDPPYCALLKLQLMVHAMVNEDNLGRIFAAQIARDESMAETMADYLESPAGEGRRAVVLCGAGHCSYGYGTVDRLEARLANRETRILIMSDSGDVKISEAMRKHVRDIEITHAQRRAVIQRPLGDYLSLIEVNEEKQSPAE